MGFRDDLKKINAALSNPNSRCYDPTYIPKINTFNTLARRKKNCKKKQAVAKVMRWQRRHRAKYRAYNKALQRKLRGNKKEAVEPAFIGIQSPIG